MLGDLTNEFSHICKVPATTLKNTVEKIEAAAPSDAKLTKIPFSTVDLLTVHTGAVGGSKNPRGSS